MHTQETTLKDRGWVGGGSAVLRPGPFSGAGVGGGASQWGGPCWVHPVSPQDCEGSGWPSDP